MRKTNLLKPLGLRKNLFRLFMLLLAIGWSTSAVMAANPYWQLRAKVILEGGGTPKSKAWVGGWGQRSNKGSEASSDYTMPTPRNDGSSNPDTYLYLIPVGGEQFVGWYKDEACTQKVYSSSEGNLYGSSASFITTAANQADVEITTIYAKVLPPVIDWSSYATKESLVAGGKYYLFNEGFGGLIGLKEQTDGKSLQCYMDPNKAVLFTLSDATNPEISCVDGGVTKYVDKGCYLRTEATYRTLSPQGEGSYMINLNNGNAAGYTWCEAKTDGKMTNALSNANSAHQRWMFIPESTYKLLWKVKSVKNNGTVTINASPTASGTTNVQFNVSRVGPIDAFEYELTGNDGHWEMGTPTCVDSVFTVPLTYTAHNVHSGTETPLSTAIVTLTAKNDAPTHASATATAYVDLQPTFTMAVNELNWSTKPAGEEVYNVGMEVAASQRERLQNKLVYGTANAIAQNNATWTATIIGTNADQFKFANSTRTVSGSYSADLLDVIYAPTASSGEGTHSATLHVEVSYTNETSPTPQTLTCVREVALSGKAQNVPMATMALNGSEIASNNESLNFGDIIGTNSQTVTVDLFIHDLTNLTKTWSTTADGVFEFDVNTIDLSKANQQFVIRAHRSTPVTAAETYEATLTIRDKDNEEDVKATLTLSYTALPLIPTTVTWNWALLNEDAIYSNPITTNSDGEWTLEQKDGNGGMTYHAETKSVSTEYMHHEPGYQAKFELTIPQSDTYTARTDTFTATINAVVPEAIYINSAADFDTYVVSPTNKNYVKYDAATNAITGSSDKVYFQWSGQSTLMLEYTGLTCSTCQRTITEEYSDGTQRQIYYVPFSDTQTNIFSVSPQTNKLRINFSGKLQNVRYFEYDTIDVNYHGIVFVEGGATTRDITATFANKRAVTVSLNAAAQPYFELRAEGKPTGSSLVYDNADGLAVHKFVKGKKFTVAIKDGVNYADAKAAAVNGFQVILQDNYTYNSEVVVLPIALEESYQVTYKHDANGSYKVTYHDDMDTHYTVTTSEDYVHTVSSIVETNCTATLSEPTPASGYMFRGWKVNGELVSCKATYTVIPASGATVEPVFVPTEEAVYGIDDARFADLDEALSTAGSIAASNPVVVLLKDVTLSEPATHTIPAGVTLLIPHKVDFSELQQIPEITTTAQVLAAYRTLTLKEGVNIVVNGNICVSGKIMAAGGGNKSAYTTGECGVINMATGGHIELNDGAELYCWGYIKGQDMDQGNNTQDVGTVTVNAGAVIHENFELGDWRGGTASSDIYAYKDDKHLFPFQSYALQNVEIPTTYTYGSKLETFMVVNTGFGSVPFAVSMIGSDQTLFLLKDANSVIRKWYDPTTDLTCYELSGTAQLDALVMNLPFVGDFNSGECNLPVSNSMHIILADCNMTLSKPLTVQAGAVVEIKNTATVNLTAKIHLFDKEEWGLYIHNYYFRSFNNLTSHKNRGAENSKDGLEDAKFIIDGTLNVKSGQGYIYSTAGGANLMGNGGGKIVFEGALPAAGELWHVTVLGVKPYITWVPTPEAAANLCNEDGSYTRSLTGASFYNVHGRWFHEDDKEALEDHTYAFTYMVDDIPENDPVVNAVYSHDKTGLEARMKWFNVTPDADCPKNPDPEADLESDWWLGTNPAAYYNYSLLGEWHQFIATETENVYSGSNNVLYRKAGCDWAEEGFIDENCLYTIGGVKKALVDGQFIPLTPNGNDPAYHATANASQYYICFTGCNWHPATPYAGESKAYTIEPETGVSLHYIWFEGDWLNVLRDEPFFYTEDEQTNVRTYYEYLNGEWEIATPYVSVTDAAETRTFYMIKEAFNVASIKKNATITLLRDLPNVAEVLTYTTQNTTCTLDLNGHLLGGNIANLLTVNAPGATFTITDNTDLKLGKISSTANRAVYVQKGALVVANGTIETTDANAVEGAASTTITINGGYFAAGTKCVQTAGSCSISGGHFTKDANLIAYAAAHKYPFETADPKYKYEVSDAWTIIFKNGETALQTLRLKPGEMPVYTENQPTKDGYKFTGWSPAIVPATADATYQAQFEATSASESRVTLDANGGNEGLQYVYVTTGSAVGTLPEGTTKEGHTFVGWFTDASNGTQITESTTVSADVTWYAHYSINSYTLTWDANGGQLSGNYTSGQVNFGAAITAPTATMTDHTFIGWNVTPATTMPAEDVTYTAQWSIAAKHYLQNIDGTYPATPEDTENVSGGAGEYVTPAVKTYDGFITPATQTVRIGEATEVIYQYARRTYTITLDANGGTCATTSLNVKHGATPTLPVATKNGVNCSGWFTKAIGGDKITSETAILYNIGTLYAQYADLNVTAPLTVSDTREVSDLRITTTGSLTINGSVTTNNFIMESNGLTASGQLLPGTGTLTIAGNAYFDLKINAKNHQWYAVAVPWPVDATNGISVNGRTLTLGKDFDIIYYDGVRRAKDGKQKCWSYVENDGDKTLLPGRLYMIALMSDAPVIRFAKIAGAPLLTTGTSVAAHAQTTGDEKDANWNGVANPALFHAYVNAGATVGQVYNPANNSYDPVTMSSVRMVVGQGAFVQAPADKTITVAYGGAFAAPRRANAAGALHDIRIAPADDAYTDRLFIQTNEDKEQNTYTIGQDLVKVGVSSKVAQMWVARYDDRLCLNTQKPVNGTADYPLGISVPQTGEYIISLETSDVDSQSSETLYLTFNGSPVWNLNYGAYTTTFEKGTTTEYGLRLISSKAPQITTGIGNVQSEDVQCTKVLRDGVIYILRGNNTYSIDGQLIK